jgi:hypothetical protein
MLKQKIRTNSILIIEIGMFSVILMTIWLDEFLDLPQRLLGAPATPYRIEEYLLETGLIAIVAFIVMAITFVTHKKIERLEGYLRVCAWCKNVWLDGRWVKFEQYMEAQHALRSTHGICERCHEKLMRATHGHAAVKEKFKNKSNPFRS